MFSSNSISVEHIEIIPKILSYKNSNYETEIRFMYKS